jgi:GTP-binding protein
MLSAEEIEPSDPWAGFDLVNHELLQFDQGLAKKRQIKVINKMDLYSAEQRERLLQRLEQGEEEVLCISLKTGEGLEELTKALWSQAGLV